LWDGAGNPLGLESSVVPVLTSEDTTPLSEELLTQLVASARSNHPELIKLNVKLNQLEVERSLAKEFLKPQLDLNYAALSQTSSVYRFDPLNDYKVGIDLSFPIFLRKERSKLAMSEIKIQNTTFQQSQAQREIINEINTTFNTLSNINIVFAQQDEVVNLYDRLLSAEILNVENGESDLFKLNIQQEKLLESKIKLLKLISERQKQKAFLYWSAGTSSVDWAN